MAVRRGSGRRSPARSNSRSPQRGRSRKSSRGKKKAYSWPVLFWLVFAIITFGLFIFNRDAISRGIQIVQREIASRSPGAEGPDEAPEAPPVATTPPASPPASAPRPPTTSPAPSAPASTPPPTASPPPAASPQASPQPAPPVTPPQSPAQPPAQPARPPAQTPAQPTAAPQPATQAPPPAAALPERTIYFIQVDQNDNINRIRVSRRLPASDSPMTDALRALIAGPSAAERERGLMSMIPPATRIISATVRDNTAFVNFSEEFLYNTYGVEGYEEQVRQVVLTATEFPNVNNVQILIEGRQIDYLGEGIWIGSPLNR